MHISQTLLIFLNILLATDIVSVKLLLERTLISMGYEKRSY